MKLLQTPLKAPYFEKHCPLNKKEPADGLPMLSYEDIFNFFMFYPSELGRKDLNDLKNSKAYSY